MFTLLKTIGSIPFHCVLSFCAFQERESITHFYEDRIQQVYQRNLELKEELQSALDEMEAFYKFYGSDSRVLLTPEEEIIFFEQEEMFARYEKFYSGFEY